MGAKNVLRTQTYKLTKAELAQFLVRYDIPSYYKVMLPKRTQPMYDAPDDFVGLYIHSFTLSNLSIPLPKLVCEVLNYYQVHLYRLNPFGCAKLTTFDVMCRAYGRELAVDMFKGFLDLCPARDKLAFGKRPKADVLEVLLKPFSHLRYWKGRFFYIQNIVVPSDYPTLLLKDNRLDKKSFKDKIPYHVRELSMYQRLIRHPACVENTADSNESLVRD
ncbi:hypothetical protein Tco_0887786 [Tanacetum coccineum]